MKPELKAKLITRVIVACVAEDYRNDTIKDKVNLLIEYFDEL